MRPHPRDLATALTAPATLVTPGPMVVCARRVQRANLSPLEGAAPACRVLREVMLLLGGLALLSRSVLCQRRRGGP